MGVLSPLLLSCHWVVVRMVVHGQQNLNQVLNLLSFVLHNFLVDCLHHRHAKTLAEFFDEMLGHSYNVHARVTDWKHREKTCYKTATNSSHLSYLVSHGCLIMIASSMLTLCEGQDPLISSPHLLEYKDNGMSCEPASLHAAELEVLSCLVSSWPETTD